MSVIDRLDRAEQGATPGPWTSDSYELGAAISGIEVFLGELETARDAEFVAVSRNHIRALIDVAKAAHTLVTGTSDDDWDREFESLEAAVIVLQQGEPT